VAGQDDMLRSMILDLVPSDGSNIGNQALLALLLDRISAFTISAIPSPPLEPLVACRRRSSAPCSGTRKLPPRCAMPTCQMTR
jgi:hypothetical protein